LGAFALTRATATKILKNSIFTITYGVVVFSIVVQGLTLETIARRTLTGRADVIDVNTSGFPVFMASYFGFYAFPIFDPLASYGSFMRQLPSLSDARYKTSRSGRDGARPSLASSGASKPASRTFHPGDCGGAPVGASPPRWNLG
jgi:hypothetical protein